LNRHVTHDTHGSIFASPLRVARVLFAGAFGGIALTLVLVTLASAGQYQVYSCSDPITGASLPTDNWSSEGTGPVKNECATSPVAGGLKVEAWAQFSGTRATWKFTAPADTNIVAATLYRSAEVSYRALAYWASPEDDYNSVDAFDSCSGADINNACTLGTNDAKTCEPRSCYSPSDVLAVPSSNLPSSQLSVSMRCLTGGCGGSEALHSADITLQQDFGPTATATGGSLTTQTVLQGVENIDISASDPGSGIFQAIFEVDGKALPGQIIDTDGGSCEPYKTESDGTNVFLNPMPCPQWLTNVSVPFDTAQVTDGPHQLTILVSDAAGNTTTILNRSVIFNNSGEYAIQVQRQEQAEQQRQELLLRGACNAECDDHAILHAADVKLTTKVFARRYARSALTLKGQLLDHTGSPMRGAVIELSQQASYLGAQGILIATTTTNAKGNWTFRVPKGPSRLLIVGYRSHSKDPTYAVQLQYHENVRAGVNLNAPSHVHPGQAFDFQGHLAGGYIPTGGILVSLEIYYGGEWREIALLRTNPRGAFAYRYTFAAVEPTTYRFRASVPSSTVYPFARAASAATHIRLLRG
jgi:hypothetical protein